MALRAWFGRSKGLFRANRRRGAADDVTTYFRACAIRLMLREFAARSVAQGDVLDLSAEWMRLSVKTTLRQSDFAAATGVLVSACVCAITAPACSSSRWLKTGPKR